MDHEVSLREAAERLGVSEKTVRRRITQGTIPARKEITPQGYEWRVDGTALVTPTGQPSTPTALARVDDRPEALLAIVEHLAALAAQNVELAQRLGVSEERCRTLEQQLAARPRRRWRDWLTRWGRRDGGR